MDDQRRLLDDAPDHGRRVYQPRNRRDCFGELIQVDSSHHRWFENLGPRCTLLVFVDDATSKLVQLYFAPSESAFAYFHAARLYLERYSKAAPVRSKEVVDLSTLIETALRVGAQNREAMGAAKSLRRPRPPARRHHARHVA